MKKNRSSQFLAICTAAVLALSVPAWASQVSITPLDTGNTTSSQSQSGASEPSTAQNTSGQTVDISSITKPTVASQGAVLLNAADGSVLFSKNGDTTYYPASITKLMTALLVAENCNSYYKPGVRSCFHWHGRRGYDDGTPVPVCTAVKICQ